MSYQYYNLPQNTSGAAVIPISNIPVPLAILTVITDDSNSVAALRAGIGWRALSQPSRLLFKIWLGAPITGLLICSVLDSAESAADYAATTDFSQIVAGLTPGQPVTLVLTAETLDSGAQAQIIGPLSFSALGTNLTVLSYYEFSNNTYGSVNIPVGQSPVPVAFAAIHLEAGQKAFLQSSVCWNATSSLFPRVEVLYKLWRGAPVTGVLVASADDSVDVERSAVTSFSHIDTAVTAAQDVTYILTAEVPNAGYTASIAGAVTFSVLKSTLTSYYTLPQNTAGSVTIPITAGGTPLASVTLTPGSVVGLRAAIGWAVTTQGGVSRAPVLFKIWRGAPFTGSLIYSALDSGEGSFDFRKVTALAHQDSGLATTDPVTYTLTAELSNTTAAVNVIGPLTFAAVQES